MCCAKEFAAQCSLKAPQEPIQKMATIRMASSVLKDFALRSAESVEALLVYQVSLFIIVASPSSAARTGCKFASVPSRAALP